MNIYEQILAKLQTKFTGADAATLQRIASKKSEGVTDEGQVQAIVDAVTFMDVMKNYGDRRADDASRTAVQTYETKHNIKDGKPLENQQQQQQLQVQQPQVQVQQPQYQQQQQVQQPQQQQFQQQPQYQQMQQPDIATAIAAAITQGLKPLQDRLDRMEGASQLQAFEARCKAVADSFGIPEFAWKGKQIDQNVDLNVYFTDLKQTMINQGYQFPAAPQSGNATDKAGDTLANWTNEGTKEIVKQHQNV